MDPFNSKPRNVSGASGILPADNGGAAQLSSIRGLSCQNNVVTPDTQFDMNATTIILIGTDGTARSVAGASTTNNISTAGPAANGRDQVGAFTNSTWVHFWWIYNGSTLATLSSASATAPTLPSGYTHKAYVGAIYLSAGGALIKTYIRGNSFSYQSPQYPVPGTTSTTENSVDVSAMVPPNAIDYTLFVNYLQGNHAAGALNMSNAIKLVAGVNFIDRFPYFNISGVTTNSNAIGGGSSAKVPNIGQAFLQQITVTAGSSPNLQIALNGYTVPNGAA